MSKRSRKYTETKLWGETCTLPPIPAKLEDDAAYFARVNKTSVILRYSRLGKDATQPRYIMKVVLPFDRQTSPTVDDHGVDVLELAAESDPKLLVSKDRFDPFLEVPAKPE